MKLLFAFSLVFILFLFGVVSPYVILQDDFMEIVGNMQEDINEEESIKILKNTCELDVIANEVERLATQRQHILGFLGRDHVDISNPPPEFA